MSLQETPFFSGSLVFLTPWGSATGNTVENNKEGEEVDTVLQEFTVHEKVDVAETSVQI